MKFWEESTLEENFCKNKLFISRAVFCCSFRNCLPCYKVLLYQTNNPILRPDLRKTLFPVALFFLEMIVHFVYFARLTGILFLQEKSAKTGTILIFVPAQQFMKYISLTESNLMDIVHNMTATPPCQSLPMCLMYTLSE